VEPRTCGLDGFGQNAYMYVVRGVDLRALGSGPMDLSAVESVYNVCSKKCGPVDLWTCGLVDQWTCRPENVLT